MVRASSKNDGRMCPQETVRMYVCRLEKASSVFQHMSVLLVG